MFSAAVTLLWLCMVSSCNHVCWIFMKLLQWCLLATMYTTWSTTMYSLEHWNTFRGSVSVSYFQVIGVDCQVSSAYDSRSSTWARFTNYGLTLVELIILNLHASLCNISTLWIKKHATRLSFIILTVVNRFSKFFHCWTQKYTDYKTLAVFSTKLKSVATLPCETWTFNWIGFGCHW